jgi:hypothetical protein
MHSPTVKAILTGAPVDLRAAYSSEHREIDVGYPFRNRHRRRKRRLRAFMLRNIAADRSIPLRNLCTSSASTA